jgi:hypothetical protein
MIHVDLGGGGEEDIYEGRRGRRGEGGEGVSKVRAGEHEDSVAERLVLREPFEHHTRIPEGRRVYRKLTKG